MRTRLLTIGSAVVLLALAAGAGGLYAYDSSRSDVIAKGITAGGVDVGGLNAARARDVLQRSLGPKLGQGVVLTWGGRHWTLPAADIDARLGVDRMVREALERSGGNRNQAAQSLGIKRTTLVEKLRKMARREGS